MKPRFEHTPIEALEAILARVNGDFDHQELAKIGPLSYNIQADIAMIAARALMKAKGE